MEIRKYRNLDAFNALGMEGAKLAQIENGSNDSQNIIFQTSQGYPDHFGAEVQFIDVNYIACACFFLFESLRQISLQEFPFANGNDYMGYNIYCFEEGFHFPNRPPMRHYIVAKAVEITIHYAGTNAKEILGPGDRIEAGEGKGLTNPIIPQYEREKESKSTPDGQGILAFFARSFSPGQALISPKKEKCRQISDGSASP